MTYAQAKARAAEMQAASDAASHALRAIPGIGSGRMGLTPDSVKARSDYREAKLAFDRAFADMRKFNGWYVKAFKAEIAAERRERRG